MHIPQEFNGIIFEELISSNKILDVTTFLHIALNLSELIGEFHKNDIIYQYINPYNILIDMELKEAKLIDTKDKLLNTSENFQYMSPEQTGRTARKIDFRTDFYSLGVVFYKMLTGLLPLQGKNEIELTYSHIAKEPLYPHAINEKIPEMISNIIMKLLSKDPEDRYKNAYGLKNDLVKCMVQIDEKGYIEEFKLGEKDIANKLNFMEKIYGRDREIDEIMNKYYKNKDGENEILFIYGEGGIGKSTLMEEIHKRIVASGDIFISGKCIQYNNTPYSPIIQVTTKLIKHILMESQEEISKIKEEIIENIGKSGQIIIDFIPEIQYLIGKQPQNEEIEVGEGQNILSTVFLKFIDIFLKKKRSIVLFLDDLQWIDSASLKFLDILINYAQQRRLFIIGSYREDETQKNSDLENLIEKISHEDVELTHINLKPLGTREVNSWICDTLHCDRVSSYALAKLIATKTGGNAFYVKIFLESMVNENILEFSYEENCWKWDINKLEKVKINENSLDLLINKIKQLPIETLEVLKLAACIGMEFDLKILSECNRKLLSHNVMNILPAIRKGIISPANKHYNSFSKDGSISYVNKATHVYVFSHDHIHEQFYSMIEENEKRKFHLNIGRAFLKNVSFGELEGTIFDVVNQLNKAYELIEDEKEIYNLAKLNLEAGKKANASSAYSLALEYFRLGHRLLKPDSWETHYELCYEIYTNLSQYECINGDFKRGEELFDIILKNTKIVEDKIAIYNLKIVFYTYLGRFKQAIDVGIEAMRLYNINIPINPSRKDIYYQFLKIKWKLKGKKIEKVLGNEIVSSRDKEDLKKVFMNLKLAAIYYNKNLFSYITLKEINLVLKYGASEDDVNVYMDYCLFLNTFFQDYVGSYEFGKKILNKYENLNGDNVSRALSKFGNLIVLWKREFKEAIKYSQDAYYECLKNGEILWAFYSAHSVVGFSLMKGDYLDSILEKCERYLKISNKTKYNEASFGIFLTRQLICNLKGETHSRFSLSSEVYDENRDFKSINSGFGTMGYYTYKLFINYLYGNLEQCKIYLKRAIEEGQPYQGNFIYAFSKIYSSLAMAALYKGGSEEEQKIYLKNLNANLKLIERWSESSPQNFLSYYLLLKGEVCRIENYREKAEIFYYKALKDAVKNELLLNMGIINEIQGKFYKSLKEKNLYIDHIGHAYKIYESWGAVEKTKELHEKYPEVFLINNKVQKKTFTSYPNIIEDMVACTTTEIDNKKFDVSAIIKASQAISREIVLENLLEKLMEILIENVGAQRGCLILNQSNSLIIKIEGSIEKLNSLVTKPIKLDQYNNIAKSVVNYAAITKQNIVLKDASKESMFLHDAYIHKNNIKSVLCSPIMNKGKFMGIIYLENNFATDVFSEQRLSLVNFLSSQAAISIENAYMYKTIKEFSERLEKKVEERTKSLHETMKYEELRTEFFANISHELRTPLNVIFGGQQMLELLIKNNMPMKDDDKIERYMATMKQNCYRLVKLINNLIDITKIDAGYFQVSLKNRNIVDIVEAITLSVAEYIENNGVSLIFDTDVEERFIACDPDKIERIMLNLLSNALKFTEPGGNIWVNMYDKGDSIVISVKDDGIGIPIEKQKSIFDRFIQVDKSLSRNREGSGIGLSIVKSLVKMHEGNIRIVSEWGEGSEFIIKLPSKLVEDHREVTSGNSYLESNKIERIKIEFSDIYN